jgi:hypothetical protein
MKRHTAGGLPSNFKTGALNSSATQPGSIAPRAGRSNHVPIRGFSKVRCPLFIGTRRARPRDGRRPPVPRISSSPHRQRLDKAGPQEAAAVVAYPPRLGDRVVVECLDEVGVATHV